MANIDVFSLSVNIIFAIIGAGLSWIIARSTPLKTELSVIVDSATIFNNGLFPNVAIEVNGQDSKVLTKSEVILWNSGFTTIYGSDVVESNLLRIELPQDSQFYASMIEKTTDDDMKFDIKQYATSLNISFNHCKQDEGVKIAILHDSEKASFKGKLKPTSEIKVHYRHGKTTSSEKKTYIKGKVRKLFLVGSMFFYEIIVICLGIGITIMTGDKLDVIAIFLGFIFCLCGGCLSGTVFRLLQKGIFPEDGPPALW